MTAGNAPAKKRGAKKLLLIGMIAAVIIALAVSCTVAINKLPNYGYYSYGGDTYYSDTADSWGSDWDDSDWDMDYDSWDSGDTDWDSDW